MNFTRQSLIVIFSVGLAMFFKSFFLNVSASVVGLLAILYLIVYHRKKIKNFNILILITFVLSLISLTGEISSPFFFLLYFLSFAVAFFLDPKVVFVLAAGLIVLLFPSALKTDLSRNLILLFSLFLLSPLAFFAGSDYQKKQEKKRRFADMRDQDQAIENDVADTLHDTRKKLDSKAANKLNQALAEEEFK